MKLFERARVYAVDPDAADVDQLSQFEVLVGLQWRWLMGVDCAQASTAVELFAWAIDNGIVRLQGLSTVDLHGLELTGESATACLKTTTCVLTNSAVSFSRHGDQWKLDLERILK